MVSGKSWVYGLVDVKGEAEIAGDAVVCSDSDYLVFKNCWSSGRFFTWTRSNDKYKVGCFYGSGEELIDRAFEDKREKGACFGAIVNAVDAIKRELDK